MNNSRADNSVISNIQVQKSNQGNKDSSGNQKNVILGTKTRQGKQTNTTKNIK